MYGSIWNWQLYRRIILNKSFIKDILSIVLFEIDNFILLYWRSFNSHSKIQKPHYRLYASEALFCIYLHQEKKTYLCFVIIKQVEVRDSCQVISFSSSGYCLGYMSYSHHLVSVVILNFKKILFFETRETISTRFGGFMFMVSSIKFVISKREKGQPLLQIEHRI